MPALVGAGAVGVGRRGTFMPRARRFSRARRAGPVERRARRRRKRGSAPGPSGPARSRRRTTRRRRARRVDLRAPPRRSRIEPARQEPRSAAHEESCSMRPVEARPRCRRAGSRPAAAWRRAGSGRPSIAPRWRQGRRCSATPIAFITGRAGQRPNGGRPAPASPCRAAAGGRAAASRRSRRAAHRRRRP